MDDTVPAFFTPGALLQTGISYSVTAVRTWINNCFQVKQWDVIINPYLYSNDGLDKHQSILNPFINTFNFNKGTEYYYFFVLKASTPNTNNAMLISYLHDDCIGAGPCCDYQLNVHCLMHGLFILTLTKFSSVFTNNRCVDMVYWNDPNTIHRSVTSHIKDDRYWDIIITQW